MKNKLLKLSLILKKDGILKTIKKILKYIKFKCFFKINFFSFFKTICLIKKYSKEIDIILSGNYDRIIIWRSYFGWDVPLFQRPQHISINMSKKNCLVFYEVTFMTDNIESYQKQKENLYLFNFNNNQLEKLLFSKLKKIKKPKYIQFYSTDYVLSLSKLKQYIADGYKIIYEYIDDLSPEVVYSIQLPVNIREKYSYMLVDTENVFVVVTADELQKDIISKRGYEKLVFSSNGVDYNHFKNINTNFKFEKKFLNIIDSNKPIVGYYGALACWFDYELIKFLAKQRPNYNIVLIGVKYDDAFDKAGLGQFSNIYFLGSKKYEVLPNYANCFDVCTIPFLINNITQSTSPLKLFEYMALEKPIVTTNMKECKKYKSVMIAKTKKSFVKYIDKALKMNKKNSKNYFNLLNKEALENTWMYKADLIIDLLKKYEKNNN